MRSQAPGPARILAFAAVVEVGTGLALMIAPAIVVRLLLGSEVSGVGTLLIGRCFGIALVALGVACWPGRQHAASSAAFRAMLIYNALIALYLTWLGTGMHLGGVLLWPAVALHAVVAFFLVWTWRTKRRTEATNK